MLRRATSLVAILLLLLTAMPVLACVIVQQRMQSGNACCQSMHGNCGEMAKTGCCRVELQDQQPQGAAHAPIISIPLVAVTIVYLAPVMQQTAHVTRWQAPDEHSPPLPQSTRPTALRL